MLKEADRLSVVMLIPPLKDTCNSVERKLLLFLLTPLCLLVLALLVLKFMGQMLKKGKSCFHSMINRDMA